ncbi:MAG TPA: hypothetical protein VH593_10520 [Ktedonobacteraceae bacterium]
MDDMSNEPMLPESPAGAAQPQPVNYEETTPLPIYNAQSSPMPEGEVQGSSTTPDGAQTSIKSGPGSLPVQPPKSLSPRLHSGRAFWVLAATIVVLVSSIALAAFFAISMASNTNHANQALAKVQVTATTRPTQEPTHAIAPKPTPTRVPTQVPTPTQQQPTQPPPNPGGNPPPKPSSTPPPKPGGSLPVQFVNPPHQASPDTYYPITVKTQPGATVRLTITYEVKNGPTGGYTFQADENGIMTLNWGANDAVSSYNQPVSVLFTATAQDANGNTGQAQTTVIVLRTKN